MPDSTMLQSEDLQERYGQLWSQVSRLLEKLEDL